MRIQWTRLLPRQQRIIPFWLIAGIAIAGPWLLADNTRIGGWLRSAITAPTATCAVASIHDGDTLRAICDGERQQVRLYCIDAPEIAQRPWGIESRDHLRAITPARVTLRTHDRDRYGRTIGEVFDPASGESLNLAMVAAGQAVVYPQYCNDPAYYAAEQRARRAGLGIWSRPGDQQTPWRARARARRGG